MNKNNKPDQLAMLSVRLITKNEVLCWTDTIQQENKQNLFQCAKDYIDDILFYIDGKILYGFELSDQTIRDMEDKGYYFELNPITENFIESIAQSGLIDAINNKYQLDILKPALKLTISKMYPNIKEKYLSLSIKPHKIEFKESLLLFNFWYNGVDDDYDCGFDYVGVVDIEHLNLLEATK